MAEKTFINNTLATLQMILFIREGTNPVNQDGTVSFTLEPGETETVTYGTAENNFLNGILLFTIFEDLYSKIQFVTLTSSELDDLLNMNDSITITKEQTDYVLNGTITLLDAVNNAITLEEMRAAFENPELGLDLTTYNTLSETVKDEVALIVLSGRPIEGYATGASVQVALDLAIGEFVNPDNIIAMSGAVNGNEKEVIGRISKLTVWVKQAMQKVKNRFFK